MKKNIFYISLLATSLVACSSADSTSVNDSKDSELIESSAKTSEQKTVEAEVDLSFNMPEKEVLKLINPTGSLGENYGMSCFTFKGENARLEVYINSLDLKEQEYPVNVEDMSTPNILVSYKISSNGETSDCCGKVDKESTGGLIITSITSNMISGEIEVDNYDGSSIKGSFSIVK
jgi:hypothetical protein